ncbi:hypothetical protein SNEBB_001044 [Seison nebaliae]|nr:hypothetical protein SNEBB_001044 [Seison nebaliae]
MKTKTKNIAFASKKMTSNRKKNRSIVEKFKGNFFANILKKHQDDSVEIIKLSSQIEDVEETHILSNPTIFKKKSMLIIELQESDSDIYERNRKNENNHNVISLPDLITKKDN